MTKSLRAVSSIVPSLIATQAISFSINQGRNQDINIEGLFGDRFTVSGIIAQEFVFTNLAYS